MTATMNRPELQVETPASAPKRRRHTLKIVSLAGVVAVAGIALVAVATNDTNSNEPAPAAEATVDESQDPMVTRFGQPATPVDAAQDPLVTRFGAPESDDDPLVARFGS